MDQEVRRDGHEGKTSHHAFANSDNQHYVAPERHAPNATSQQRGFRPVLQYQRLRQLPGPRRGVPDRHVPDLRLRAAPSGAQLAQYMPGASPGLSQLSSCATRTGIAGADKSPPCCSR